MPPDEKGLSREDLFMFMEFYKNTSTANTTLLEQQKSLLEKQNSLLQRVADTNISLGAVSDRLDKNYEALTEFHKECGQNYVTGKSQSSIEHSKLSNKIYVTYGILGGIIIALISMVMQLSDKFELIEAIAQSVGAG